MHDLSNILIEVIFILLHFFLFQINYFISQKSIFYPATLFSLLWTIISLLHFIFGLTILNELNIISLATRAVIFFGSVSFSLGAFFVATPQRNDGQKKNITLKEFKLSFPLRLIFLAIILIGLPFYIQATYRVFVASQIDNFFVGLRTELSYGEEDIGPTKYLVSFCFIVFGINYFALLRDQNILNKIVFFFSFLLTVVYSVFATGRSYFFMILAIYLGVSYLHKKQFSIKKYISVMLIFFPVFILIGIVYGKGGNVEDSVNENIKNSTETTAIYIVTAMNALDTEITQDVEPNYQGDHTLLFFVKIAKQLNLIPEKKVGSLLSEFVFTPYPTNVYTFYSPYIRDFGILYAWLMIGIFGALHTWLFYKARDSKSLRHTLYYSFLLYPLLMSFFQDQYMGLFSTWLQLIFYTEIFLVLQNLLVKKSFNHFLGK